MKIEKTNIPGYVKDADTQMVTNKNIEDYKSYLKQREKILQQNVLEQKINTLENQVGEIYSMLKKIASKV